MSNSDRDPELARVRLWSGLALAGMFVVGAVFGAGLARRVQPPPPAFMHSPPGPREAPAAMPHRGPGGPPSLPELVRMLDLSPEQAETVHAILERHRPEAETILRETFPRLREVESRTASDIRAALRPEQQTRFDALRAQVGRGPGAPSPVGGPASDPTPPGPPFGFAPGPGQGAGGPPPFGAPPPFQGGPPPPFGGPPPGPGAPPPP